MPIVMLTAKGDEVDRVLGLEMGADDYVVKPFSPRGAGGARPGGAPPGPAGARAGAAGGGRLSIDVDGAILVTVDEAAADAHPQGVRSAPRAARGARDACSRASTSSTASGAMPRPGRSSRARWTSTCAGCGQARRRGAAHPHREERGLPAGAGRLMRRPCSLRPPPHRAEADPDPGGLHRHRRPGGGAVPQSRAGAASRWSRWRRVSARWRRVLHDEARDAPARAACPRPRARAGLPRARARPVRASP